MYDTQIPIVMATDNNFVMVTFAAIQSIINSKAAVRTLIIILVDASFNNESRKILNWHNYNQTSVYLKILTIDSGKFAHISLYNKNITKTTLFRLLIPNVLQEFEKCVYLDGDILAAGSLEELFDMDMNGNYLAGVRDKEISDIYLKKLQLNDSLYINAGVLVFDLKEMRNQEISQLFWKHLDKEYVFADQDILNICCKRHILQLPDCFNIFGKRYRYTDKKDIRILHFAGNRFSKPWLNKRHFCNREWMELAAPMKETKVYRAILEKQAALESESDLRVFLKKCMAHRKTVIFGFSETGKMAAGGLAANGYPGVIAYCDNNRKLRGMECGGIPVKCLSDLRPDEDTVFVNTVQNQHDEVRRQLLEYGVAQERIVPFWKKGRDYYYELDEAYFEDEFRQLLAFEHGVWR